MPVFESSAEDVLGLWSATPASAVLSFSIGEDTLAEEEQVYRVHLQEDSGAAWEMLRSGQARLLRMEYSLENVPERIEQLVERTQKKRQQPAEGVSFDTNMGEPEAGPESELLALLAATDRAAAGEVSFGIGDLTTQAWVAARAQFDALIAQIDRDVLHFAWVETDFAGQLIARTSVSWNGDTQTVFDGGITPGLADLHESTLKTVSHTRQLRLRMFVTIASGSAKVAALLASPGGAVLALPAVYQYVTQIVAQAGELTSIQTPQGE